MENESSKQEILSAINDFSTHVDQRFSHIDQQFSHIDQRFSHVDQQFSEIRSDIISIRSQMVTKDYLDEKMSDLRGDLVVLTRKEDQKLNATLDLLVEKKLVTPDEAKHIKSMEPFPQLAL